MIRKFQFLPLIFLTFQLFPLGECWGKIQHEDDELTLDGLLIREGFDGLSHYYIRTPDNYTLSVLRIKQKNSENMKPVLFLHGWSACAESYFTAKNRSLPVIFAKNGYDVWLLNNRGTINANHSSYNAYVDKEYWDFSWEEIGLIDVPMAIDLVLDHNKHSKLILLGQSAGSTVTFVLLSELPEYNDKISLTVHLGVSVYHTNCGTNPILGYLCKFEPIIKDLFDMLGVHSLYVSPKIREFLSELCQYDVFKGACAEAGKLAMDSINGQVDFIKNWSYILKHALCSGGVKELIHYVQVANSGRFAKFNYGVKKNLKMYNSTVNPLYRLENIRAPIAIFNSEHDIFLKDPEDTERLLSELTNIKMKHVEIVPKLSHIDIILGKDMETVLYPKMLKILSRFKNEE